MVGIILRSNENETSTARKEELTDLTDVSTSCANTESPNSTKFFLK